MFRPAAKRLVILVMVPSGPDLDLDDDVPLAGQLEEIIEPPPVLVFPTVQVELVVYLLAGKDVAGIAIAHHVADVIATDGFQQIEVPFQADGVVEQVVLPRAARQQDRFALVLPLERVVGIGLNTLGVVRQRHTACRRYCQRQYQEHSHAVQLVTSCKHLLIFFP